MADTITVKSKLKDNAMALWERHPLHPEDAADGPHEVSVYGDAEVEVGLTPLVRQKIQSGQLEEVSGDTVKIEEPKAQPAVVAVEAPTEINHAPTETIVAKPKR